MPLYFKTDFSEVLEHLDAPISTEGEDTFSIDESDLPALKALFKRAKRPNGFEIVEAPLPKPPVAKETPNPSIDLSSIDGVCRFKEELAQLPDQGWADWGWRNEERLLAAAAVLKSHIHEVLSRHYDVRFERFSITGPNESGKTRTDSWTSLYLYKAGAEEGTRLEWKVGFRRMTCISQDFWEKYLAHLPGDETQLLKRLVKWK